MRARNKTALQSKLGLTPSADAPLFGVVSRISSQKGLDLCCRPCRACRHRRPARLARLRRQGARGRLRAGRAHPGRSVGCIFGYDERLAHLFQAGADFILVPSRFEPCGLTQLCALRYGATPIVAHVGGLADTVIDANEAAIAAGVATGLQFSPPRRSALYALDRARGFYHDATTMRRLRLNGMRADVSWRGPAKRYAALYRVARRSRADERERKRRATPASRFARRNRRGVLRASPKRVSFLPLRRRARSLQARDRATARRRLSRSCAWLRRGRALRFSRRRPVRSRAGPSLRRRPNCSPIPMPAFDRPLRLHPSMFERGVDSGPVRAQSDRAARRRPASRAASASPGIRSSIRAQSARLYAAQPGDPRTPARNVRRPRASASRSPISPASASPAVEIMPADAFVDERHLPPLGLTNAWGYNPVVLGAPDPRLAPGGWAEVRAATDALHAAGMEASSTSFSIIAARATNSGRRSRSAGSTTPPISA